MSDRPTTLEEMTRDEKSLLLYFETCAVDHAGLVDTRRMSDGDREIAGRWNDSGFVTYARVRSADIERFIDKRTHACFLSDEAFRLAHEERRTRQKRMESSRVWRTISEEPAEEGEDVRQERG